MIVHYEYYDGSVWCEADLPLAGHDTEDMIHPRDWEEIRNPLRAVTCKECLKLLESVGEQAKRRYLSLLAQEEAKAKAQWIIP